MSPCFTCNFPVPCAFRAHPLRAPPIPTRNKCLHEPTFLHAAPGVSTALRMPSTSGASDCCASRGRELELESHLVTSESTLLYTPCTSCLRWV